MLPLRRHPWTSCGISYAFLQHLHMNPHFSALSSELTAPAWILPLILSPDSQAHPFHAPGCCNANLTSDSPCSRSFHGSWIPSWWSPSCQAPIFVSIELGPCWPSHLPPSQASQPSQTAIPLLGMVPLPPPHPPHTPLSGSTQHSSVFILWIGPKISSFWTLFLTHHTPGRLTTPYLCAFQWPLITASAQLVSYLPHFSHICLQLTRETTSK